MLPEEALAFVKDILAQFRAPECSHTSPYFPFTEQTCRTIIEEVHDKDELT
jgi:hypothetical protein